MRQLKKTPKEWLDYQLKKGLAYRTKFWLLDGRKYRKDLARKMTLEQFEQEYCV